jgi:hypothetical protein
METPFEISTDGKNLIISPASIWLHASIKFTRGEIDD